MTKTIRQGDILFIKLNDSPSPDIRELSVTKVEIRGEAGTHTHVLERAIPTDRGVAVIEDMPVRHDDPDEASRHPTVTLTPGEYEVRHAREVEWQRKGTIEVD